MENQKFDIKRNSFDILKYWAAFSVMFLHYTYYAFMEAEQAWGFMDKLRKTSEFFPGVIVLFTISGFLISDSMERSKSRSDFLKKRVFRLYPELWLCTIINLIVIFILAGEHLDGSIFIWLGTQIVGIANTPSCLDGFATGSVNGALWTIFVEIQLYLLICFGYEIIKRFRLYQWGILLVLLIAANLFCDYLATEYGGTLAKLIERSFVPYALWFMIGAFCYQYKDKVIKYLRYLSIPILILYWGLRPMAVELPGYYVGITVSIMCPVIIIGLAYLLPTIRIRVDLTYGMFLYHWIVLNIIVHFELLRKWNWKVCLLFFIIATLALAWGSQVITKRLRRRIKEGHHVI